MAWLLNLPPGVILEHLVAFAVAVFVAVLATRVMVGLAARWSFVSRPRGDRWSRDAVPLGGGIAMFLPLALGLGLLSWDLLVGASLMFVLGLIDDRRSLSPPLKLVVQTVAACWMVAGPLDAGAPALLMAGPAMLVLPLTVAWYVGVTNSVNLLDNMDGSAAGVAAVAGCFIYILAVGGDAPDSELAATMAVFVGVAVGFLVFNFPPARIFMGDAGALLLGFALAGLAIRLPDAGDAPLAKVAVAAFVLGIPLFDTALVWVSRRVARRPFLEGGKDHAAHRLVALGLSERRTCLVLYGVAALLGGAGLAVARGGLGIAVLAAALGGIALVLGGVFLGDVPVYAEGKPDAVAAAGSARGSSRPGFFLYAAEVAVDVAVLSACWIGAYAIRFDEPFGFYLVASALPALPFVIAFKVSTLLFFNLYRGLWRTIRFEDVVAIAKAVSLASLLIVVAATAIQRFENYSRGVIVIDWLLTCLAVVGSRSALRFMRGTLARLVGRPQRAVLLGPEALRPLLEPALAGERYEFAGRVEPGEPDAVVEAARGLGAEVVIVANGVAGADSVLDALSAAGLRIRRLEVHLD